MLEITQSHFRASEALVSIPEIQPQKGDRTETLQAKLLASMTAGGAKTGGNTVVVTPTLTVSTAIYAAGDSIGGLIELEGAMRTTGGTGVLSGLVLVDVDNVKPELEILLFDQEPTAATIEDQAAVGLATDHVKIVGRVAVTSDDWVTVAGAGVCELANLNRVVRAVGGASVWCALVAVGTPDFTTAAGVILRAKFFQD